MDMKKDKDFLERLCKGLATQFGSNCEVVVHDIQQDYEESIIAIENGHITRRKVGDGGSEIVLQVLKSSDDVQNDHLNYLTKTQDGKILKSSSIYIRDDNNKITGILSINFNMTDFMVGESAMRSILSHSGEERIEPELIPTNVQELLDILIDESCNLVGKPVSIMNKEDKTRAIQYLDSKGAFLVKKSGDRVAEHFGISKYTLYNYLDTPRSEPID